MVEFYSWTQIARSCVSLLLAFCVMTQTLTSVLSFFRRPHRITRLFENLLELLLLFHIVILSLLMGQEQHSHVIGLIVPTGYVELRTIAVALVVLFACVIIAYRKNAWPLLIIAVSCMTLPLMETLFGKAYAWLYIAALLFWLLRSVCYSVMYNREVVTNISALSIKEAVDSLHTGVLFSESEGQIALINIQMQRLMSVLTGGIHRNGRHFYELLVTGELLPGCRKTEYEGQIVCLLPDEAAWMFTRTEIQVKNKRYHQLTATDITERWALTAELQRQEELLILRGEELRQMIEDLKTLSKIRELKNAKLRAHDILGQRLTMLLHSINSGQEFDYNLLRTQLQSLPSDLKSGQSAASPENKLWNLQRTFQTIGVEIQMDGILPKDDVIGYIFVDVIGESVVNAVRHGFASNVFVRIDHSENIWHLEISDNGNVPSASMPVKEGGGIGGMRNKVEPYGGLLTVTNDSRFILKVALPGGIRNV